MASKWNPERLIELRKASGFDQSELASKVGVARETIVRWESGKREPNWTGVLALCEALGVECTAFAKPPKKPTKGDPS